MTQNNEREAFEKWSLENGYFTEYDDDGTSTICFDEDKWIAWQARAQSPISQNEQPKQIPVGWKLVPIEPTEEMLYNVDVEIGCGGYNNCGLVVKDNHAKEVYKAMINASQTTSLTSETNTEVGR